LAWVGLSQPSSGQKNFQHEEGNCSNYHPVRSKKITSGQVKKYPGQSRTGPIFTAGHKVCSGLVKARISFTYCIVMQYFMTGAA